MNDLLTVNKALADQNRLRILNMVRERPVCVCDFSRILGVSNATVSTHLSILKNAKLVEADKRGRWVFYKLAVHPNARLNDIVWQQLEEIQATTEYTDDVSALKAKECMLIEECC